MNIKFKTFLIYFGLDEYMRNQHDFNLKLLKVNLSSILTQHNHLVFKFLFSFFILICFSFLYNILISAIFFVVFFINFFKITQNLIFLLKSYICDKFDYFPILKTYYLNYISHFVLFLSYSIYFSPVYFN